VLTGIREMIKPSEFLGETRHAATPHQWSPSLSSIEGFSELWATGFVEGSVIIAVDGTNASFLAGFHRCVTTGGLVRFGPFGLIKSLREVTTLLLMRLAFGTGCRFGMFCALRSVASGLKNRTLWFNPQRQFRPSCCLIRPQINPTPTG